MLCREGGMSGKAACLAEEGSSHPRFARFARNALCELRSCLWYKTAIYSAVSFRFKEITLCLCGGEERKEYRPVNP